MTKFKDSTASSFSAGLVHDDGGRTEGLGRRVPTGRSCSRHPRRGVTRRASDHEPGAGRASVLLLRREEGRKLG